MFMFAAMPGISPSRRRQDLRLEGWHEYSNLLFWGFFTKELGVAGERVRWHYQACLLRRMEEAFMSKKVLGSVMVVGGGIAGIQASLDLANSGYYVHLVEKSPAIGGKMAQIDKTFPTNDCAM
jgi:hypothetical protein